jgi:hypothetical protein
MSITRTLGGWVMPAVLLCGLTLPAAADGLSRFEEAIKQAPPGAFAYNSGKALGDSGFILEGVVVTPPPDATAGAKAEPIAIKRISVEDFDFASVDKNLPPNFVKLRVEGIAIGPKPAEGVDLKEMTGLDKLNADFQLDYRIDADRKTMTLNRMELDLNGLARLELSMVLDGINPEAVDNAANDATLRTASLVYEDHSLLGKTLPTAAKMQGADADGLIKMAKAGLDGLRSGQGPAALAVLDALASYVDDYKQPKGALKITLTPTAKTSVAALGDIKDPEEAIKSLGLVVSYPGARPQAPEKKSEAAPSPADAAAAAAAAAIKAGAKK